MVLLVLARKFHSAYQIFLPKGTVSPHRPLTCIAVAKNDFSVRSDPVLGKSDVRYCISAAAKLTFRFYKDDIRLKFINDLDLGLIRRIENRKEHFLVPRNPQQGFSSLVRGFIKHPVELARASLFAGKVLVFYGRIL
ncbi:MAG: hypothetical protein EXR67_05550 [Dehalococcoidia bacterium]|nr:hypothetical protein [Dehalococcoidia bacterium]